MFQAANVVLWSIIRVRYVYTLIVVNCSNWCSNNSIGCFRNISYVCTSISLCAKVKSSEWEADPDFQSAGETLHYVACLEQWEGVRQAIQPFAADWEANASECHENLWTEGKLPISKCLEVWVLPWIAVCLMSSVLIERCNSIELCSSIVSACLECHAMFSVLHE